MQPASPADWAMQSHRYYQPASNDLIRLLADRHLGYMLTGRDVARGSQFTSFVHRGASRRVIAISL